MTLLHVYFTLRNQQVFKRLLEQDDRAPTNPQSGQCASAGKSWSPKNIASVLEVNAFDSLGRTVLHLACSSTDAASLEYARMLLAHPCINVNLTDKESHWTALHRALYVGNIEAAIMLLKRTDTDISLQDMEGYTAFDLYNSTVQSANPTSLDDGSADLLTWGANRNAALGLGDSNDRTHPDNVVIRKKDAPLPNWCTLEERFQPVRVRSVIMSKLHTVILTDEPHDNIRLCGFGSGGRLGPFPHSLYTPTPLSLSQNRIVSVAVGQDHTLALTNAGEVISWGLNRFYQLGYIVEAGHGDSVEESVQTTPRKVVHLKREFIHGIAACRTASVCWSDSDVWTWGTNCGQLGYCKAASPVQILPRKASVITQPIRGVALSEIAMVCLFITGEVVCVWNENVSKINFPAHTFPSDLSTYRPPQADRAPRVTKLAVCDDLFAALTSNGEVFTFSLPTTTEAEGCSPRMRASGSRGPVKPQYARTSRRYFSNVRVGRLQLESLTARLMGAFLCKLWRAPYQDVDIGGDGALIVCTLSGHVFLGSRNLRRGTTSSGTKAFKFQRIAHVQRAVAVCANNTGAFGALQVDYKPIPINVTGRPFAKDMAAIAPYSQDDATVSTHQVMNIPDEIIDADDDLEDSSIFDDIGEVAKLMTALRSHINQVGLSAQGSKHGADLAVRVGTQLETPAHRVVLAARCIPLREVLCGHGHLDDKSCKISATCIPQQSDKPPILHFTGVAPLSLLILLHYLYADEVLAIWDHRIGSLFEAQLLSLGLSAVRVKEDLVTLARLLRLPHLAAALQSVGKRVAKSSACDDFQWLFNHGQRPGSPRSHVRDDPLAPDVALRLADRTVYTHSTVLRARSAFFAALFTDPGWTADRRDDMGVVDVEMGHHTWQIMQFVLPFICFGEEKMFETLDNINNVDELLEFMFLVISVANELLLTRLVLLCSQIIVKHLNVYNACYLLTDAIHFNAVELAARIQSYMTANLESLLESRILDDLDPRVVRKLSEHVRAAQAIESPVSRSDRLGLAALEKHKEWLALQDIPAPIVVPTQKPWSGKDAPPGWEKKVTGQARKTFSPTTSPTLGPSSSGTLQSLPGDDIFAMDNVDGVPSFKLNEARGSKGEDMGVWVRAGETARPGWKMSPAVPRTDLKAIMAEAENGKKMHARPLDREGSGARSSTAHANTSLASSASTGGVPARARVPLRQQGHVPGRWRPDTSPTPHRVPSDAAGPQTAGTCSTPTPSDSSRGTQARSRPAMGPVITPARQMPSASGPGSGARKPTLGGAWALSPAQPTAAPTVPSSRTESFAEIQRMQALQGSVSTAKDKRSLRDIQEEERAHQQEADFLRWWAAEEERVRLEMLEQERGQGREEERGQATGPRAGTRSQNKEKGRIRKPGTETRPGRDLSGGVTRAHGSRRA